jgi:hypothetical protein
MNIRARPHLLHLDNKHFVTLAGVKDGRPPLDPSVPLNPTAMSSHPRDMSIDPLDTSIHSPDHLPQAKSTSEALVLACKLKHKCIESACLLFHPKCMYGPKCGLKR